MKLIIDIDEKDYLECVKRVEEIREKGYMIENLKYKIIIADGTPLSEELEKVKTEILEENRFMWYSVDIKDCIDKHIAELKGE